MHRIKNKNYNYNEINIPKQIKQTIQKDKQKKTITKEQEEQEPQDENTIINPSIFGYNTLPITYQPILEPQEQVAIEQEAVENFATEEIVSTPNEEEMRKKRDEYYSQDDAIAPTNFFDEAIPISKPISKDDFNSLVFFDEMP